MAQILYLTNIQIDFGVLATLGAECEKANINRPLIVTDQGVKAVGILQKAMDASWVFTRGTWCPKQLCSTLNSR
jgi:alcohol dehydrogenase class IV